MLLGSQKKQKKVKYEVDPNEIQLAKPRYEWYIDECINLRSKN